MLLLEHNADPTIVNGSGQRAKEVTHDKEIRNMLEGKGHDLTLALPVRQ